MFSETLFRKGAVLLVHSSTSRILKQFGMTPNSLLRAFLDALGPDGTLLLPLFNFNFTSGIPFDLRSTKSQMGALTEAGRNWPDLIRTGHPVYGFAAIGRRAGEFRNIDNYSGYGDNSPFALLHAMDGQIAVMDLPDQNSMTFYHYVEEQMQVPYRHNKDFSGQYTDIYGHTSLRTYSIFVRDIEAGVVTSVDRMGERLWELGLYRGERPHVGNGTRVIDAGALFDETSSIIRSGKAKEFLYETACL